MILKKEQHDHDVGYADDGKTNEQRSGELFPVSGKPHGISHFDDVVA